MASPNNYAMLVLSYNYRYDIFVSVKLSNNYTKMKKKNNVPFTFSWQQKLSMAAAQEVDFCR
jgi:hypothetical protein